MAGCGTLIVTDHANTDFQDVKAREPIVKTWSGSLEECVKRAKSRQSRYRRGHHYVCEIRKDDGTFVHVSPNGRVWDGRAVEWTPETVEVLA